LATGNLAKIERYKKLLLAAGLKIKIFTCEDLNLQPIETEEVGKTLEENAILKAQAYRGKVNMPILSNDTGFWVKGEGLVEAPKRAALSNQSEFELSEEERFARMTRFWKDIAKKHGGKVDAAWIDAFALVDDQGQIKTREAKREVILTETEFGKPHKHFPIRALYISKLTGKPAVLHTPKEELVELEPLIQALTELLSA
jgi:inosine/xanthosine triphosphate pyrophosphatase family protein